MSEPFPPCGYDCMDIGLEWRQISVPSTNSTGTMDKTGCFPWLKPSRPHGFCVWLWSLPTYLMSFSSAVFRVGYTVCIDFGSGRYLGTTLLWQNYEFIDCTGTWLYLASFCLGCKIDLWLPLFIGCTLSCFQFVHPLLWSGFNL